MTRRLAFFFGCVLALVASQIPEYGQQYRQRLGGAISELRRIVAEFDADGTRQGLTRAEGLARLESSPDAFVRDWGFAMQGDVSRLEKLSRTEEDMTQSGGLARLAVLAVNFDPLIAREAYASYEPAVPVTAEGLLLSGAGFIAGYAAWRVLAAPFRRRKRAVA